LLSLNCTLLEKGPRKHFRSKARQHKMRSCL
jgi:hypothetical protein